MLYNTVTSHRSPFQDPSFQYIMASYIYCYREHISSFIHNVINKVKQIILTYSCVFFSLLSSKNLLTVLFTDCLIRSNKMELRSINWLITLFKRYYVCIAVQAHQTQRRRRQQQQPCKIDPNNKGRKRGTQIPIQSFRSEILHTQNNVILLCDDMAW